MKIANISIVVLLCFFSCNNKVTEISKLNPLFTIDQLEDSTFFKDISFINYHQDYIYVSDNYNGRIIKLDNQWNLVTTMGNNGQGPGEFYGVGCSQILQDTLYVVDYQNLRINVFTLDGQFITNYKINDYSLTYNRFCVDSQGVLCFNSISDSLPFVKYDRHLKRISTFGSWYTSNEQEKSAINNFMLVSFNGKILCIQRELPRLYLYNNDGILFLEKELENDIFASRTRFRKNALNTNPKNRGKVYNLFTSVSTFGDKIYLLFIDHNVDNDKAMCNKIVELLYVNNDFTITNVYQLDTQWYTSICVIDNTLIAFSGTTAEFHIYQLKN